MTRFCGETVTPLPLADGFVLILPVGVPPPVLSAGRIVKRDQHITVRRHFIVIGDRDFSGNISCYAVRRINYPGESENDSFRALDDVVALDGDVEGNGGLLRGKFERRGRSV